MNYIKENAAGIITVLLVWVCISVIGSMWKNADKACAKTYPIDYIIYTKLFCEIKP